MTPRDHFGFDASDYDAPDRGEQDAFFAERDEMDGPTEHDRH